MKKIQLYRIAILTVLPAMLFTSCRFEDDDFFTESAALRIEHTGDQLKSLLTEAPNGWVFQYFCGTDGYQYEGFNMFADFYSNGKVTLASNHRMLRGGNAGKYTEASSVYDILNEDGLVLAFNTWNDVLTPLVDPVLPSAAPNNLVKDGQGMLGDQNLVVMSFNDDEVILRGERHGAECRLVKCDTTFQGYINETDKMKNYIASTAITTYYVTNGSDTLYISGLRNGRFRYSERLVNNVRNDSIACCFTPKGFRIEKQDSIGQNTFQEFSLAADSSCLVSENGDVKIIARWDEYVATHTALWKFDASFFTSEQQSLYDQISAELQKANKNYSLAHIGIGKSTGAESVYGLVFTFYTSSKKTDKNTNTFGVALNLSCPAFGMYDVAYNADCITDKNLNSLKTKATQLETLARSFAATLNGLYNVTPNNFFAPTGGLFTSTDGSKSFVLK